MVHFLKAYFTQIMVAIFLCVSPVYSAHLGKNNGALCVGLDVGPEENSVDPVLYNEVTALIQSIEDKYVVPEKPLSKQKIIEKNKESQKQVASKYSLDQLALVLLEVHRRKAELKHLQLMLKSQSRSFTNQTAAYTKYFVDPSNPDALKALKKMEQQTDIYSFVILHVLGLFGR